VRFLEHFTQGDERPEEKLGALNEQQQALAAAGLALSPTPRHRNDGACGFDRFPNDSLLLL
jgi:hypothetical protein